MNLFFWTFSGSIPVLHGYLSPYGNDCETNSINIFLLSFFGGLKIVLSLSKLQVNCLFTNLDIQKIHLDDVDIFIAYMYQLSRSITFNETIKALFSATHSYPFEVN